MNYKWTLINVYLLRDELLFSKCLRSNGSCEFPQVPAPVQSLVNQLLTDLAKLLLSQLVSPVPQGEEGS